uniref:Uncharacterized protein n=2 Tax=Haplochromini TaxID=319058 RepID=A0A3B4ENJ6_9CICH
YLTLTAVRKMLDGFSATVPECLASAPSINSEIRNGVTVKQTKRSIFLQVPAMTGSVHPRNLEDPLLLQTIYIVYIILNFRVCRANAPTSRSKYAAGASVTADLRSVTPVHAAFKNRLKTFFVCTGLHLFTLKHCNPTCFYLIHEAH